MNLILQEAIDRQRSLLKEWLSSSLVNIANDCKLAWTDRAALEDRLMSGLEELPYCKYLYLLDKNARQITADASRTGLQPAFYGRDRSKRPYLALHFPSRMFTSARMYGGRR